MLDEPEIALAPMLFGGGRRLFETLSEPLPGFRIDRVVPDAKAMHLRNMRV